MSKKDYTFPFIERANQETIDLLLEARTYARAIHGRSQAMSSSPRQLLINCEAMRMISRLARIMAWILECKAAPSPSVGLQKDGDDGQPLDENALCMDTNGNDDARLPFELRVLLQRSYGLYVRVARLDAMIRKGQDEIGPGEFGGFTARLVGQ
jgi:regulator of CtrA degradation